MNRSGDYSSRKIIKTEIKKSLPNKWLDDAEKIEDDLI
jgi:hypothetical protein